MCKCGNPDQCPRMGFDLMVYRDPCSIDLSQVPAGSIVPESTEAPIEQAAGEKKPYPWWILALLGLSVYYLDQQ